MTNIEADRHETQTAYYDVRSAAWSLYQRRTQGRPAGAYHSIYITTLQHHLDSMRDAARLIDHRTHVLNKTQRTGTTAEQEAAAAALKVAQDRYNELLNPAGRR